MDPSSYTYTQKSPSSWRSARRPSRSAHSQQPPRLGAISEDGAIVLPDTPPELPPRAHNRPLQRMFHLGFPPTYGAHGEKAPEYGEDFHNFRDVKGPRGEDFQDLRHNRHLVKRGGWKRLVVIASVILTLVLGLAIGLGVGLTRRNNDDSSDSPESASSPPNQTFPLGSYTFETFLSTVSTSCTPNSATWSCFPYQTYSDSTTGSFTRFNWIITSASNDPTSSNPADYLISSSNNPFALTFTNTTIRLLDPGLDTEALGFTLPMQKIVIPNLDISGDGSASRCLYNDTAFAAKLYTKMARTYPPTIETDANSTSSGQFQSWPFAVEISQTISSGSGVPDCYRTQNGDLVSAIDLAGVSTAGDCACEYLNFGT